MFEEMFREAESNRRKTESEFEKLATDPPSKPVVEGSRVLIAAGVMGKGHHWGRLEATVLEVADTAYRVRYASYKHCDSDEPAEEWVHRFAVTDVLKQTTPLEGGQDDA